jgi:hypothetical protein
VQQPISKLCADSLRTLASEVHGTKLKPTHAHELVAAYFGYRSKNAFLADEQYPISALPQAELVVTTPDEFFNKRRMSLQELSPDLPDNSILYEAIRSALLENGWLRSPFPPFSDFDKLARSVLGRSPQYDSAFPFHRQFPHDHFVVVKEAEDSVLLTVAHAYSPQSEDAKVDGYTTITLPRVAGRIGYGAPELMPTSVSGQWRITLKSLGVRL